MDNVAGGLGNKRKSGNHPKDSIIKIGQNAEKSPGDLRRLAVSQTPVEGLRLTLIWKTLKGVIIIIIIIIIGSGGAGRRRGGGNVIFKPTVYLFFFRVSFFF